MGLLDADFAKVMIMFISDDIFKLVKALTDEQRTFLEECVYTPELFNQALTEMQYSYWIKFIAASQADPTVISRYVCTALLSGRLDNRQLGISLELLIYPFIENTDYWLTLLKDKDCNFPLKAVHGMIFNGIHSGYYDRAAETLTLLFGHRTDIVISEQACPECDPNCLYCADGIKYYLAGTTYK